MDTLYAERPLANNRVEAWATADDSHIHLIGEQSFVDRMLTTFAQVVPGAEITTPEMRKPRTDGLSHGPRPMPGQETMDV